MTSGNNLMNSKYLGDYLELAESQKLTAANKKV
jgi:hypothetical protein